MRGYEREAEKRYDRGHPNREDDLADHTSLTHGMPDGFVV
jgi:hypothetical protein